MAYATIADFRDYMEQIAEYGQQRITVTGAPSGGIFTLLYEGVPTGTIAPNATATAVQATLQAHAAIGSNVKVIGPPGNWQAIFAGALAKDAGPLSLGTNSLTGGTSPSVVIVNAQDARIQKVLDRATQIIDTVLQTTFPVAGSAGEMVIYGDGTDYLVLPPFVAGSVTLVTAPSSYTVPDYVVQDGALVITRNGIIEPHYGRETLAGYFYAGVGGWNPGVPYTIAATFGYAAVPEDIKEACLEIAVDLYRFKDAGSIKMVGVDGAGVVSGKGLPPTAKIILDARLAQLSFPGVW